MIFVTVGNWLHSFDRLLRKMGEIAGRVSKPVVIQRGHSSYQPQHAEFFDYVPIYKALDYFKQASIIVGHVDSGTIINAHKFCKPLVAVPRQQRFNEDVDDHRLETARVIVGRPGVYVVFDPNDLDDVIFKLLSSDRPSQLLATVSKNDSRVVSVISEFVRTIDEYRKFFQMRGVNSCFSQKAFIS